MTGTAHPNEATAYPTNHERMALATRCKLSRLSAGLLVLTLGLWHAPAFDGFYGSSSTMHEGNLHFSSSAKIIQKPKQTPLRPMTVMDLQDVSDSDHGGVRSASRHSAERDPIISLLQQAGIAVDDDVISMLPEWSDVKALYGEEPVVLGMESCDRFRKLNPPERRFVGVAGQMNSGTNALGKYLYDNLRIRSNPFNGGMLAGVPWNKHGWTSLRNRYKFSLPEDVDSVLPVILIRDPYFWMKSMCESPYTMRWNHSSPEECRLISRPSGNSGNLTESSGNPVDILWGIQWNREWQSLAHVWSEWYREYYEASYPRLMIRFEDLLFHTPTVLQKIRQCVGASWKQNHVVFTTEAMKKGEYYESIKKQSSMLSAMIKYGQDKGRRTDFLTTRERKYASYFLDNDMMNVFHYTHPSG